MPSPVSPSRGAFPICATVAVIVLAFQSPAGTAAAIPNDDRVITHALNRLAFGPGVGDVEEVKRLGLGTWIERQLQPARISDAQVETKLRRLTTLTLDPATLARDYFLPAREERRRLQQQAQAGSPAERPDPSTPNGSRGQTNPAAMSETARRARQVLSDLSEAKLLRAVYSERQLEEVLADFWFNHFNVFGRKGQVELYLGAYERDAIRPHVLGSFRDLLEATAKSPAMLFYLDNWMSADPNATLERPNRGAKGASRRKVRAGVPFSSANGRDNDRLRQQQQRPRGLNENYARELLELHTLGVDGGYTQQDVVEVARAFTGWTISPPQRPGEGFRFVPAMHDRGEKRVLGHVIRAGGGIEDGERVLDIVANHPSTARHIAFKLAQRFVSDTPPPALVDRAAARFRETRGDLREVVRTIVTSPEFFAPAAYQAKVKTPFEFVVSALRATGADVSSGLPAARALATLGMPLYLCQPPTGYDETADTWVSAGALVNRINFAVELGSHRVRGVHVPVEAGQNIAKLIGSPEFQKQ